MRRNRNLSRGIGGGSLNSGGPLLTAHLQDIDLELELLKRKREMLEQQQYLQPFNQQPQQQQQRNFNRLPYFETNRGGSTNDYNRYLDEGPQQRKPFAKKRLSDNDWQHNSFPKRSVGQGPRDSGFTGPSPGRNQKPFNTPNRESRPGFKTVKPFVPRKFINQQLAKPEKKFVAAKITKPTKAVAPPNKIASQPVAERSNLVAAAIKSVEEVENRSREALRLLPDKVPTKQMTGRLELALGSILKDIRESPTATRHYDTLRCVGAQRIMKNAIRERIRTAMLGKVVGATQDIITEYRAMFPVETDSEIVEKALDLTCLNVTKPHVVKPIGGNRPDEYFKENMCKLIEGHLLEFFNKMDEIYNPKSAEKEAKDIDFTEDNLETDTQEISKEENKQEGSEAVKETDKDPNAPAPGSVEEIEVGITSINEYKRLLPRLLKRNIPNILKLLQLGKMYRNTVADIAATTRAKFVEYGASKNTEKSVEQEATTEKATTPEEPPKYSGPYMLPYYVKVMGKPQLPKKKSMQAFLEVFNPKSIKRHRTIHNLLFIGFSDKNSFDEIVKADGTVIANSTISIRVCDKTGNNEEANSSVTQEKKSDASADSVTIGSDLEGQITDLLTAIRSSGEEKVTTTEVEQENKPEQKADETKPADKITEESKSTEAKENLQVEKGVENDVTPAEEVENPATTEDTEKSQETATDEGKQDSQDAKSENSDNSNGLPTNGEKNDHLTDLKNSSGRSTPTRTSSRLANAPATPSSIRTRRASRLVQN